jgi:hypothetical protein
MTILAELSSDSIATSCGIEVKSPSPVLALCRELVRQGCDPVTPLQAYRGDTLCLTVRSIGEAASLEVVGGRFTQAQRRCIAPSMRLTQPSSMAA